MHTLGGGACGLRQGQQRHRGRTAGAWRGGGGTCKGEQGEGQGVMSGPRDGTTQRKQVMRPAWLMCAKTLPLAGLLVPNVSALPTLGLLRVKCNTGPTRLLLPCPTHHHHHMQASAPTYRYTRPSIQIPTNPHQPTHQHTQHHITRQRPRTREWSSRAGGSCVGALLPCPCRLCPCLVTCTRAGPSAAPTPLSSGLLLSWRLAVSRPSHSPSALMGPPVHGPSKRLQGRVCLGAWGGREGVGQGHSLAWLSLASHKRGVRVERRCGRGADWAAVVSPSPRDEASAKQVLPWRDRHGPLMRRVNPLRQPWVSLCVSGWSHGCAVQPLQRPVTVASAHYRPGTPYVSMLLTDQPPHIHL
jgi:hypothetical protein